VDPQYAFDQWQIVKAKLAARDAELARLRERVKELEQTELEFSAYCGQFRRQDKSLICDPGEAARVIIDLRAQLQTATERAERAEREVELFKEAENFPFALTESFHKWLVGLGLVVVRKIDQDSLRAVAKELADLLTKIAKQRPSRLDYWNTCRQCEDNSGDADELLARYHAAVADGHARKEEA